jgi:hypothetical protein
MQNNHARNQWHSNKSHPYVLWLDPGFWSLAVKKKKKIKQIMEIRKDFEQNNVRLNNPWYCQTLPFLVWIQQSLSSFLILCTHDLTRNSNKQNFKFRLEKNFGLTINIYQKPMANIYLIVAYWKFFPMKWVARQ